MAGSIVLTYASLIYFTELNYHELYCTETWITLKSAQNLTAPNCVLHCTALYSRLHCTSEVYPIGPISLCSCRVGAGPRVALLLSNNSQHYIQLHSHLSSLNVQWGQGMEYVSYLSCITSQEVTDRITCSRE